MNVAVDSAPHVTEGMGDLGGVGELVAGSLRLLLHASDRAGPDNGRPVDPGAEAPQGRFSTAMARELALVEAAEAVRSWVDSQQLAALGRLHEASVVACRELAISDERADRRSLDLMEREAGRVAVDEVVAATGLGQVYVEERMALALTARATADQTALGGVVGASCPGSRSGIGVAVSALAAGAISAFRVGRIFAATGHLPAPVVAEIAGRLVAPMRDGSVRSHRSFTRELRRLVVAHTPDQGAATRDAIARRDVSAYPRGDGTGALSIVADETIVSAVYARIDKIARALRAAGDSRTIAQLRSDAATDLLLRGWPQRPVGAARNDSCRATLTASGGGDSSPASTQSATAPGSATQTPPSTAGEPPGPGSPGGIDRASGYDGFKPADAPPHPWVGDTLRRLALAPESDSDGRVDPIGTLDAVGTPPPAIVHVVVSLATLLGLEDGVGHQPGWGEISAAAARRAALTAGSVWRRMVVDPLTGTALELSTRRYRPTPAMAATVAALDGHCRAPGCVVPAGDCDLDHQIPWPTGTTSMANLNAKHRRHHNHKTLRTWQCIPADDHDPVDQDGALTWTTQAGRTYTTWRIDWLDLLAPLDAPTDRTFETPPF